MSPIRDIPAPAAVPVLDRFTVTVDVIIRLGTEADLIPLEWHGEFTAHRSILARAYRRYERYEMLMLVAEAERFPVGQIWIDFMQGGPGTARLWTLRVLSGLRCAGIGSRLLRAAEQAVAARGLRAVELGCEKSNTRALRLYEIHGYRTSHEEIEHYAYETPWGEHIEATSDMWIMRKPLQQAAERADR